MITVAKNVFELIDFLDDDSDDLPRPSSPEEAVSIINQIVNDCTWGMEFGVSDPDFQTVYLVARCPDVNNELPKYEFHFPITREEFTDAYSKASSDSLDEWMFTHGCEECAKLYNFIHPQEDYPIAGRDGKTPTHFDCTLCDGQGVSLRT